MGHFLASGHLGIIPDTACFTALHIGHYGTLLGFGTVALYIIHPLRVSWHCTGHHICILDIVMLLFLLVQ